MDTLAAMEKQFVILSVVVLNVVGCVSGGFETRVVNGEVQVKAHWAAPFTNHSQTNSVTTDRK